MADDHRARIRRRVRSDLPECRPRLVDQQVDHVPRALLPKRAETPQESLAGERRVGPERHRTRHVEAGAHALVY